MATAEGKILCSLCQKAAGVLTCLGCGKDFCYRHVIEHRQELNKQIDEITTNHDQLKQAIFEQEAEPNCHPFMKTIDEWEEQSIEKIRQAANDVRKRVLILLGTHRIRVTNDLASFTRELGKARNEDDYVETDLKKWTEKIDQLISDLNAAHLINFGPDNDVVSLIPNYFINDASTDIFYQTIGDVQINETGKVVIHGPTQGIAAARCRGEYSSGQYRFRFRIEQLFHNPAFCCGIISKNTPLDSIVSTGMKAISPGHVMMDPKTYRSLNSNVLCSFNQLNSQFRSSCTYEILFNCSQLTARLTSHEAEISQMINADLTTCPFPWQFFIAFFHPSDRVCLC